MFKMSGPSRTESLAARTGTSLGCSALAAIAVVALASGASAGVISDPFITVTATNASGSQTLTVPLSDTTPGPNGMVLYFLPSPVTFANGATISGLGSIIRPQGAVLPNLISLNITVVAGASNTTWQVNSALFALVPNIFDAARASAGVSLTDTGGEVGAQFTGAAPGGGSFYTAYNGQAPGGSQFASLLAGPVATALPGGSASGDQQSAGHPLYIPIGLAANMSSEWRFVLTAGDTAGVTSAYEIIPAPGAISLLALAGLVAVRRSRK
jgi:hypothetical protein